MHTNVAVRNNCECGIYLSINLSIYIYIRIYKQTKCDNIASKCIVTSERLARETRLSLFIKNELFGDSREAAVPNSTVTVNEDRVVRRLLLVAGKLLRKIEIGIMWPSYTTQLHTCGTI